jgi:nitrite reductase (NADH) small subunit
VAAEDIRIGPASDIAPGAKRIVDVGGRSLGIYHSRTGDFFAVLNVCPHALAPICVSDLGGTMLPSEPGEYVFGMDGFVLKCPWHAWEFDVRTGDALFGTDRRRLATFPVRVEDGELIVTIQSRKAYAQA